jgi:IS5 family transposase
VKKKNTKRNYRLRNWKQYNKALVQRGSLTLWISDEMLNLWLNQQKTGKRGRSNTYSDIAISCMATLKEVFHLPLRATQGLLISILDRLKVEVTAPDYSTLSRRCSRLAVRLPRLPKSQALHLVVDSTGVKVFGEGEWKVRQHGYSKRRTWRKLHIGADESSNEIVAAVVTTNNVADAQVIEDWLEQVEEEIEQVSGDGSYDKRGCYQAIKRRKAKASIRPQKNAKIWQHGNTKQERINRDENLRRIRQVGRKKWKQEVGYHPGQTHVKKKQEKTLQ